MVTEAELTRELKILKGKETLEKLKHKNRIAEIKLKHEFDMELEKVNSENHFGLYKLKRSDRKRERSEDSYLNATSGGVNG